MLRIDLVWIESDLYWHTLHDFHITPRRVLWRNQTEARAGTGLNAVDVRFENFVRISIDGNVNRLTGPNISYLALFEVRRHPNFAGNNRQQGLAYLDQRANLDRFARDASGFRRINPAVRKLQFRFIDRRLQLLKVRAGRACLRFADGNLLRRGVRLLKPAQRFVDLCPRASDLSFGTLSIGSLGRSRGARFTNLSFGGRNSFSRRIHLRVRGARGCDSLIQTLP